MSIQTMGVQKSERPGLMVTEVRLVQNKCSFN